MTHIASILSDSRWLKFHYTIIDEMKNDPDYCCTQLKKYLGSLTAATINELRIVRYYFNGKEFKNINICHIGIVELENQVKEEIKRRKLNKIWK